MKLPGLLAGMSAFGMLMALPIVQSAMLIVATVSLMAFQYGTWSSEGGSASPAVYLMLLTAYLIKTIVGLSGEYTAAPGEFKKIKESSSDDSESISPTG